MSATASWAATRAWRAASDRARIRVTLRITSHEPRRDATTVDHEEHRGAYLRASFMGEVIPYRRREASEAGQIIMSRRDDMPPDLVTAWDRWHLNDMRSHCAHQDRAIPWDKVPPCPETGYRASSAWLLEPLTVAGAVQCVQSVHGSAHIIGRDGVAVRVLAITEHPTHVMHGLSGLSIHRMLRHEGWTCSTVTPAGVADSFGNYGKG